ncbi:MAG TPA: cyclic peptide export ABC transporter [Pyrinomonadaceae bacterium]|nr:cyclic peptide export ABC transporter [Pyrinomonadaceae bacterium]
MKLLRFLLRYSREVKYSRGVLAVTILTGVAGGLVSTALLALINSALGSAGEAPPELVAGFVALCVVLPVLRFVPEVLLLRLTQGAMYDLRLQLCRRILSAPLRQLEDLKPARLLATLTEDIPTVTGAIILLPLLCLHGAVLVGCLVYLGWLSPPVLVCVLGFMAAGVASYQLPTLRAMRYFKRGREEWDGLVKHFRALTEGTKELKLHRERREAFLSDEVRPTADSLRRHQFTGNAIYLATRIWGQLLFFVLIGLLLFALPRWQGVGAATLTGYVLALLYMMTPLEVLLNMLPAFGRAKVAMEKVEALGLSLAQRGEDAGAPAGGATAPHWRRLDLVGVTHTYYREGEHSTFTLGPIDLSFRPGEIVFLAGGNGSGKTTLAKLLTGLYTPEGGEISMDGRPVRGEDLENYRQLFSAVFSDFYLFDRLLGLGRPELDEQARRYLAQLQLAHKVRIDAGRLSTTDLSQGQRKRLALLTAYLEERPFYVFDEWAADQDPAFKNIFYLSLLPELKARGKTALVITHDDRYYHVADRLVKLNYGSVESDERLDGAPAAEMSAA